MPPRVDGRHDLALIARRNEREEVGHRR
jgi:hypothetical protein